MEGGISPPRSKRRRLNTSKIEPSQTTEHDIRIYSWNINGIAPFLQPEITSFFKSEKTINAGRDSFKASLRDFLRRHNWPSVLFLQEVKIHPEDETTIRAIEQAVRKQANEPDDAFDYNAHFCLPSDKYNARGFGRKVYGVCSIIRKDFEESFVEKIRRVTWDAEGRFLVIETKASGALPKLAIINIYAVNGTDNPYKDPGTGEVVGTRHDRKLQVHRLLQAECGRLEAAGLQIILAGDMNIARSRIDGFPNLRTFPKQHCLNRADFEAKFFSHSAEVQPINGDPPEVAASEVENDGLGMIDTFRFLHRDQKSYTYYPRSRAFGESCDRVDMIIVSRTLKDSLKEAGMFETAAERGPSDHVPLYARLIFREAPDHQGSDSEKDPVSVDSD